MVETAECASGRGDFFHFVLSFYTDADATNLVHEVDSAQEWYNFYYNGSQFTERGAFLCEGTASRTSCAVIEYRPPLDGPDVLFNQILYVKPSKPIITFEVTTDENPEGTLIIYVVDESGSMRTEHDWLIEMTQNLESRLLEKGIGPNTYGLVGFGRSNKNKPPGFSPYKFPLGNGQITGTVDDIVEILRLNEGVPKIGPNGENPNPAINYDGLSLVGGPREDGYDGINSALSYPVDTEFTTNIILVTDEDRDIVNQDATFNAISNLLNTSQVNFHAVVAADFISDDGPAIGINPGDGRAWIAEPGGAFAESTGGAFAASGNTGSPNVKQDYVDLGAGLETKKGFAWNLNLLRDGGEIAESFSNAFIETVATETTQSFTCENIVEPETSLFFCARENIEDNEINITFYNDRTSDLCVHGRITFYADEDRKSVVFSHFSLLDQRRWFERNNPPCPFNPSGVKIEGSLAKNILYVTDVRPIELMENATTFNLKGGEQERTLTCGATYYVDVEAYFGDTKEFELINQFTFNPQCRRTKSRNWRENDDARNWVSSYNGGDDFRVSRTSSQSLNSTVSTNIDGQFFIAWQDFRDIDSIAIDPERKLTKLDYQRRVMYGVYDATQDIFFSSGQGHYDTEALKNAIKPLSVTDFTGNFYMMGNKGDDLLSWKCAFTAPEGSSSGGSISSTCLQNDGSQLIESPDRSNEFFMIARVYEPDTTGSYVIEENNVISVVEDYIVRLEASGLPGAYAVRLRNDNDDDWSEWINIDNEFSGVTRLIDKDAGSTGSDNEVLSAYYIDSDRFIVPWILSCGSGVKKVSLQVMTFAGVSQVFTIQILANVSDPAYEIIFAEDENFESILPTYNGFPVANLKSDEEGIGSKTVYIKVEFKEKEKIEFFKNSLSKWNRMSHLASDITFDVIQQGANDQTDLPLTLVEEEGVGFTGIYTGSFQIYKSDGVFNKDGSAAIVINSIRGCNENAPGSSSCGSDTIDKYNLANVRLLNAVEGVSTSGSIQDYNVQQIIDSVKALAVNKVSNINDLKAPYNADDPENAFGNPNFYVGKK